MDLGNKLKYIRTSRGYSMEELKNRLNEKYNLQISKSMISRWENGKSEPLNTYLSAYAKEFNLDLNELLEIETPKVKENDNVLDIKQEELIENYNKSNSDGKKIILDTSRNISKAYPIASEINKEEVTKEEMIEYLKDIPLAAYDGNINIHKLSYEELKNIYNIVKEDD